MKFLQALGIAISFRPAHCFNVGQAINDDTSYSRLINTTSGIILGHAAANNVSEYLGIPFAQPPLGDLRFAAPQPYRSNSSTPLNASSYGPSCMVSVSAYNFSILTADGYNLAPTAEEYFNIISEQDTTLSEDCLTLNVWTKPETGEEPKAVMVFVHGGGFQGGTSDNPFLTGQHLAEEQDVVIITINYRTNVFGFPGVPSVSGVAPNAGLLDQRLAIEWVRDNVASFGGDPSRITLFGQSAGAASVSTYGYAYASDPIAHGFITQSGTASSFGAYASNNTASFTALAEALGCNTTSSNTQISNTSSINTSSSNIEEMLLCVRAQPASAVLTALSLVPATSSALGTFAPIADGATAFSNYTALPFAQVPHLLGSDAQEGGQFRLEYAMQGLDIHSTAFWEWYTLAFFTCPTASAAEGFADAVDAPPVWRYMYHGDYPNTQLTVDPSMGAYHGSELNPLFGTSNILGIPDTESEKGTARYMRDAWAGFAKDPDGALGMAPFSWPRSFGNNTAQIINLGAANATAVLGPVSEVDANCTSVMAALEILGGPVGLLSLALGIAQAVEGIEDGDVVAVTEALLGLAGVGS